MKYYKLKLFYLFIFFIIISSCISKKVTSNKLDNKQINKPQEIQISKSNNKEIKDILITEEKDSLIVEIKGNKSLEYSSFNPSPLLITLLFPNTTLLQTIKNSYAANNDVFNSIETKKIKESNASKVEFLLKKDLSYRVEEYSNGIKVIFKKISGLSVSDHSNIKTENISNKDDKKAKILSVDKKRNIESISDKKFSSKQKSLVNRIEFLSESQGKSTLVIGTNKPVDYKIKKVVDKRLHLQLFNTKLPEHKKRPLITTRFESAIDRVLPIQTSEMGNMSIMAIDLRETVPYMVEQNNNSLKIHFEASKIPPKLENIKDIALWKDVLIKEASELVAKDSEISQTNKEKVNKDIQIKGTKENKVETLIADSGFKYTGEKIALDFYETDIKNVFRLLKQISGKNYAIDKDVAGKVTLSLEKPVPWDQILDLILKMNQLGKIYEGDIIRIATIDTLKKEKALELSESEAKQKAKEREKVLEALKTTYIPINYSDAGGDILPHLDKIMTKERGSVSVDKRTNTIIMTDVESKIKQAKDIITNLDIPTRQVIIEAKIVEVNNNFSRVFGFAWNLNGGIKNSDTNAGKGPQRGYDALGGTYGYNFAVNGPVDTQSTSTTGGGFNFLRNIGSPFLIDAQLKAMEDTGYGKIISSPKILTLDNKKATITQGLEVPYISSTSTSSTTLFKKVDLSLDVTPHITPDSRVSLNINLTKNEVGGFFGVEHVPYLITKTATTELLVNDGDTIVIGGIIKSTNTSGGSGLPGFSKLPLIGWLFKTDNKTDNKEELLIFITPTVVQLEKQKDNSQKIAIENNNG